MNYSVEEYFSEFERSFSAYILPHRDQMSGRFSAVAQQRLSMIIYLGPNFLVARLINKWIGQQVKTVKCSDINPLLEYEFGNLRYPQVHAAPSFGFRYNQGNIDIAFLTPTPQLHRKFGLELKLNGPSCFVMADPHVTLRPKYYQIEKYKEKRIESGQVITTNWLVQYVSYAQSNVLSGLDDDPRLFAYAMADYYLMAAKVRPQDYFYKHLHASSDLKETSQTDSSINESKLQELIAGRPWIIHEETEYLECLPEPRLHYGQNECIRPDFVFKCSDGSVKVVEIEAATKRIHTRQEETGFAVMDAKAKRAVDQIENYRTIIGKLHRKEICQLLGVPVDVPISYLLVIGMSDQPDFDRKSWNIKREKLSENGIEVRTWDYYIDRQIRTFELCKENQQPN